MNGAHDRGGGARAQCGVLITNLGTPDAPTAAAVRRYLREFLSDRRVVDLPRWLWLPLLYGVILPARPRRTARAYAKIWDAAGSPLLAVARRQAEELRGALSGSGRAPAVALGMRYGNPSIGAALDALRAAGVRRVLVLPLYPQYCSATTASTFDAVAAALARRLWIPQLRFINDYHDEPWYVRALAEAARDCWRARPRGERLLLSFHGMPQRLHLAGDPYFTQCRETARLVAQELELPPERWAIAFQSRFGREEWLRPYTDETLREWAAGGVRSVDVMCPGFSADCLETLEEIAIQNAAGFLAAGGERLGYIPALNDRPDHIAGLAALVEKNLCGWAEE